MPSQLVQNNVRKGDLSQVGVILVTYTPANTSHCAAPLGGRRRSPSPAAPGQAALGAGHPRNPNGTGI